MNKSFIKEVIIPKLPQGNIEFGRALINQLVEPNHTQFVKVLTEYQNCDGGFGNGLEADIQLPISNVASTDIAISLLEDIDDEIIKENVIQKIVSYLESVYDPITMAVELVPKEVDQYPHAVWWNYDQLSSFTYGNPNPEVAGFLLQYRKYIQKIDIDQYVNNVVKYIQTTMKEEKSMHSLLSALRFYKRVGDDIQQVIFNDLQQYVDQLVELDPSKWVDYALEPYKIARIEPLFLKEHMDVLDINLSQYEEVLQTQLIKPNWQWFQYNDVFEVVQEHWIPLLTYDVLYVIMKNRK